MEYSGIEKVLVIHTLEGYEEHERWINHLFDKYKIDFEFMTGGDPSFFTNKLLTKYFTTHVLETFTKGKISITLNHLLCYEKMVTENIETAIIFEDDSFFLSGFKKYLEKFVREFRSIKEGAIVSIENSTLRFPSWRSLKKGKYLYQAESGRACGAYLINLQAAKNIVNFLEKNKCPTHIDWWHNELIREGIIKMYWAHPPIVEQGSHSGRLQGSISIRKKNLTRRLSWVAEKFYKMYIIRWFK